MDWAHFSKRFSNISQLFVPSASEYARMYPAAPDCRTYFSTFFASNLIGARFQACLISMMARRSASLLYQTEMSGRVRRFAGARPRSTPNSDLIFFTEASKYTEYPASAMARETITCKKNSGAWESHLHLGVLKLSLLGSSHNPCFQDVHLFASQISAYAALIRSVGILLTSSLRSACHVS
jgi:hypothetical protein